MAQEVKPYEIVIIGKVTSNNSIDFIQTVNPKDNSIGIAIPDELKSIPKFQKDGIQGDFSKYSNGDLVECVIKGVSQLTYKIHDTKLWQQAPNFDNVNQKVYLDEIHELNGKKIYVPCAIAIKFDAFKQFFKRKLFKYCNMMFLGHSGFGKTTLASLMGHELSVENVKIDMAGIINPINFIGYDGLTDGNTHFKFNDWITKMQRGNCIVTLDEIDKMNPQVGAILNPVLDGSRELNYRDFQIKIGENVGFIGTMNYQWEDTASNEVSASLMSRFHFKVEVDCLPVTQEIELVESFGIEHKDAVKIVDVISKMRKMHSEHQLNIELSTRKTEFVAELVGSKAFSIRMALEIVYTDQIALNDDTERTALTTVLNSSFGQLKYDKLS